MRFMPKFQVRLLPGGGAHVSLGAAEVRLDSLAPEERTLAQLTECFRQLSPEEASRLLAGLRSTRRSGIGEEFDVEW